MARHRSAATTARGLTEMLKTRLIEPADPESAATHTPTPGLAPPAPKPAGRTPRAGRTPENSSSGSASPRSPTAGSPARVAGSRTAPGARGAARRPSRDARPARVRNVASAQLSPRRRTTVTTAGVRRTAALLLRPSHDREQQRSEVAASATLQKRGGVVQVVVGARIHAVASAPLCSSSVRASVHTHRGARGVAFGGGLLPSHPRGAGARRAAKRCVGGAREGGLEPGGLRAPRHREGRRSEEIAVAVAKPSRADSSPR